MHKFVAVSLTSIESELVVAAVFLAPLAEARAAADAALRATVPPPKRFAAAACADADDGLRTGRVAPLSLGGGSWTFGGSEENVTCRSVMILRPRAAGAPRWQAAG